MFRWWPAIYDVMVTATFLFGLAAWALLITGSLAGLAGSELLAEQLFTGAGWAAWVFVPLLLASLAATVAAPDR